MSKIAPLFFVLVGLIAAVPQVRGENSTALANSTVTHTTATKVVDSKNHLVGTLLDSGGHSAALVGFNGAFYFLLVSSKGFVETAASGGTGLFLFENSDCSGPASLPADPSSLYVNASGNDAAFNGYGGATVSTGILYFPQTPISQSSFAGAGAGVTPANAAANCQPNLGGSYVAGPVGTFDLSRLGLIPPFKLK
jgi:hypothetical protein